MMLSYEWTLFCLVLQVISHKFGTEGNCQNIRVHLGQDFNLGILNNDYRKWFQVFHAVQTTGTVFKLTTTTRRSNQKGSGR